MKNLNNNLHAAKKNKNDEFYTRFEDIERELAHYKDHFKGKTVFCNCDDPVSSNFVKYFALCFEHLELKRLIVTHYDNNVPSYWVDITHGINNLEEMVAYQPLPLAQNGDFRSNESINFLKQSDIVVTNPPFSLFREYLAQLIEYEKKFLIIGSFNAVTYKEVFPLIKDNKIWLGHNLVKEFVTPSGEIQKFGNIVWYTNLPHKKRNEELKLFRIYHENEEHYPKYDDYDAIEVSKTVDIPKDFKGLMGVPISFLDKYNPKQFEILGLDDHRLIYPKWRGRGPNLNGKAVYRRIIIKNKMIQELHGEDI